MKKYILEIICSIVIILSLSFIVTLRFCNLDIKSSASQYDQDNVDIVDKVQIPLTDISILNNIEYYEGICSNDTTISARYVIRNIGNNPLVIQYVNPNCSAYCNNVAFVCDSCVFLNLFKIGANYNV